MSVEAIPGGKRRIYRVLGPRPVAHVDGLELEEPRARRGEAEAAASANRRAVQHVVDLLRGELARRYRNGTASVAQLPE